MTCLWELDPDPYLPYGKCESCGADLDTKHEASVHMSETQEAARREGGSGSHRVRVVNATRADRVRHAVDSIVLDAVEEAMDELEELHFDGGATREEMRGALRGHSDFYDEWENR